MTDEIGNSSLIPCNETHLFGVGTLVHFGISGTYELTEKKVSAETC
jgi:hypothetical protein